MTVRENWSSHARRLGIASTTGILVVGVLYAATIMVWLIVEAVPAEPISDPYLAVMEVLTIASAVCLLGTVMSIWCFADAARRLEAIAALTLGSAASILTSAIHFVQLTAQRQLWAAGRAADYRLVWPSAVFALEYFVWDVLVGLTMVLAASAIIGARNAEAPRRVLLLGGVLCLVGIVGPLSGRMFLQNVALLGYGLVLPIAAALIARLFRATPPHVGE